MKDALQENACHGTERRKDAIRGTERTKLRFWRRAAALGALTLLGACQDDSLGGGTTEETDDGAPNMDVVVQLTPCEERYGDACGAFCDEETSCATGLYCELNVCVVDCFEDADCVEGICTDEGRCHVESKIVLDPTVTDPTPVEEEAPTCVEGQVEFEAVMPQVWLLLDRSGSMNEPLVDVTRWDALGAVLLGAFDDSSDRGVVGEFDDRVAFGATFYTQQNLNTGCALVLESVALAVNSYSAIRNRYNKLSPSGGTPTADAVAAVVAQASTSDLTGGPKILVLASDGSPGPCKDRLGSSVAEVENEVALAFSKSIQTFAISITAGVDAEHMQRVANLGVGLEPDADPPAPYFTAESQTELKDAFSTIISDVPRSCVFELNGEVEQDNADEGTVVLAGQELIYRDENGWVLKQADQVELLGSACEQIQAGEEELDINFPCSVFTPTIR